MRAFEFLFEDQTTTIQYHIGNASNISRNVMAQLSQLIAEGSEVDMIVVDKNLRNAESIAYAMDGDQAIGVIALKNPINVYRHKVFIEANVPELERRYNLEIGYAFVKSEYRARGVGVYLCRNLVRSTNAPIFATTREANTTVNKLLQFGGFRKTGDSWTSGRGSYNLLLWTKG
jgi:predicted GNAT family acetyltransferase